MVLEGEPVALGEKIKTLRKQHRLSQGALAAKIGINPTHLGRLESGKYTPSVEVVRKLAEIFEVSFDCLLRDDAALTVESRPDQPLTQHIRLAESLDEADQRALMHIIDCMLTKQRMRQLLHDPPLRIAG